MRGLQASFALIVAKSATAIAILCVALSAFACFACTEVERRPASTRPRIVSLSPAMTRTVMDLGAGELIVGRTPWCAATDAPVVGTLQDRDLARIAELRPTIIMVQAAELDAELARVAKSTGAKVVLTHIDRLADVEAMVSTLAGELASAHVLGAEEARDRILAEAARAREEAKVIVAAQGPTLILFGTEPPTAFGALTYVDDLWSAMGGQNAVKRAGYPELTLEDIVRLDPAHILLVRGSKRDFPPALEALPLRLKERLRIVVAPTLLEPSSALLREGPAALLEGASKTPSTGATSEATR